MGPRKKKLKEKNRFSSFQIENSQSELFFLLFQKRPLLSFIEKLTGSVIKEISKLHYKLFH